MRPLFNSNQQLPGFPPTGHDSETGTNQAPPRRAIFMDKELPTADQPLEQTSQEYYNLNQMMPMRKNPYMHYMLLGLYPTGPYDDSPVGKENTILMSNLITNLIRKRQFTAFSELMQRCEPLKTLRIDPSCLPPEELRVFLATVSTYQPDLPALEISTDQQPKDDREAAGAAGVLADFIARSPSLKALTITAALGGFCIPVIDAVAHAENLESLSLGYGIQLSDKACDKLKTILKNSSNLKAISLSSTRTSEENMLDILRLLCRCSQLESIHLCNWHFNEQENITQLGELIGKSGRLKNLTFSGYGYMTEKGLCLAIEAIATGITANRSLDSINIDFDDRSFIKPDQILNIIEAVQHHPGITKIALNKYHGYMPPITRALADLLEKNRRIIDVGIELQMPTIRQHWIIFRNLKNRWSELDPSNDSWIKQSPEDMTLEFGKLFESIEDRTARNKAVASGAMARIFSNAFFASAGSMAGSNHIADPGLVLTEHILMHSPSVPSFQHAMVEIALSLDERAKLEAEKHARQDTAGPGSTADQDWKPGSSS